MKTYSEILQLPIMEILEGKKHEKSKDVIMNLDTKEIALVLEGSIWGNLNIIKAEDLEGIGDDFIMIMTSKAIQNTKNNLELSELLSGYYSICGIKAVTTDGNIQGAVKDFKVDVETKKVTEIELENGDCYDAKRMISISEKFLFLQTEAGEKTENSDTNSTVEVPEKQEDDTSYLIGKTVTEDIVDEDGFVILEKGTTVTEAKIQEAKESEVLADLILNAE